MLKVLIISSACTAISTNVSAQPSGGGRWDYHPWMYGHFGPIGMIIFWLIVVAAIVFIIRWITVSDKDRRAAGKQESPLDILKRRYAAGDITREEFEQTKRDITG